MSKAASGWINGFIGVLIFAGSLSAWIGVAYGSVFSMMIDFVIWYRGLAQGGIAQSANCSCFSLSSRWLLRPFCFMRL
jgi:hypothetical protein